MRVTSLLRFFLIAAIALAVVVLATPIPAQAQTWGDSCQSALPPRLVPGQQGRVTPGLPNLLRTQAGIYGGSQVIGSIPGGGYFNVVYGYASQCANGMWWTLVNYNGIQGWTPEGSSYGVYWTEPAGVQPPSPPPPPACPLPARLVSGGQARVTPGLPNVVRSVPGQGWNSIIVGTIPGGAVFTVLAGYAPQCADGMQWYYVSYNGLIGWTAEGQNGVYWVEPVTQNDPNVCGFSTRLHTYAWARVTPGLPNNVRAEPAIGARWLGRIPAGATFQVINGPVCANGILWWQANYNGLIGWTGEGRTGTYWLEYVGG